MHKKRQQKLTDENLLNNIGLIFVSKITNYKHFIFCLFHIITIMWLFYFNTAKVQVFVFAYGVFRPYSLYKFLLYLLMNVLKYQQVLRCLSASYNKFSQKDDENCVGTLYPLKLRRFRTMPLTSSIYGFCQEVYHYGSRKRSRFLYYSLAYIPLTFCKALLVR